MTVFVPAYVRLAADVIRYTTAILLVLAAVAIPVIAFVLPEDAETIARAAHVRAVLTGETP